MQKNEIIEKIKANITTLNKMGVRSIALFGSIARDEETSESDIDLLVDFYRPPGFTGYMEVKFFLEDLLGTKIDLVMEGALKPWARERVLKEAIYVS